MEVGGKQVEATRQVARGRVQGPRGVPGSRGRVPKGRAAWPGQGVESPSPAPPPSQRGRGYAGPTRASREHSPPFPYEGKGGPRGDGVNALEVGGWKMEVDGEQGAGKQVGATRRVARGRVQVGAPGRVPRARPWLARRLPRPRRTHPPPVFPVSPCAVSGGWLGCASPAGLPTKAPSPAGEGNRPGTTWEEAGAGKANAGEPTAIRRRPSSHAPPRGIARAPPRRGYAAALRRKSPRR